MAAAVAVHHNLHKTTLLCCVDEHVNVMLNSLNLVAGSKLSNERTYILAVEITLQQVSYYHA
jgi:hypothetical protein